MKKTLLGLALIASAVMPATANAADGNVRFKGNVKGLKDSLIVITPRDGQKAKYDTVLVKNGQFEFSVNVEKPTSIYGYTPGTLRQEEQIGFQAIAVPGENAEVSGDFTSSYYLTGSTFYKQFDEADRAIEAAGKPYRDLMSALNARMAAGEDQQTIMKEYQEKGPALQKQVAEATLKFIKDHPTYEASAAFIANLPELEQMKEAVQLLSPEVREGRMKPYYQAYIDQIEAEIKAEAEAAKKQAAGIDAPDFTLNDINGKPLALSSLRGKYVVLDFWGSWCVWCIKGFPEMKNYYEKYKGKFEILGIDCNDPEDKWKAAVEKHQLPWLHVYNPRTSSVLKDYAIQGFPTKIIVGPDGKIVKTIVGEDPSFYTFLDELFGK